MPTMPIIEKFLNNNVKSMRSFVMDSLTSKQYFLAASALVAATMLMGTAWMSDDAFITLRVIDNFVNGYGLRYNVIERVQVFTHPLWLFLLTPFYALTREAMVTTMVVSVFLSLGALWLLAARIARNIEYGCLLVLVAVASRAICHYSTSGLESPLTFLLSALFVWQLYSTERIWIPAGIAGLLWLNRLDLVVLLGPAVSYLLFHARGGDRVKVVAAAIFPALAWMIFSVIYYGAPFPNTAYAKLGTGYDSGILILHGLAYAKDFVLTNPLLALIMVMAVINALRMRDLRPLLLGAGIVLYVSYIIVIGGDFMSGRFFAPPGFLALCLLAQMPAPEWLLKRMEAVFLIAVAIVLVLLISRVTETEKHGKGIGDEQRAYYSYNGLFPVLKKWAGNGYEPIHPWGQLGVQRKTLAQKIGKPIVVVTRFVGMEGYYAGPDVHNVDRLALTDAFLARLPALPNARVGHYERMLPPGYAETALSAAPATEITALIPLLNDVILATRAPLFAEGRWSAIWRLLSGKYSWVYEADLYGENK